MAELVEGARLEIVFTGNSDKGSNPFLSAIKAMREFVSCIAFLFSCGIMIMDQHTF